MRTLLRRLAAVHDLKMNYDVDGTCRVSREAMEAIQEIAGLAEVEITKTLMIFCDMNCGICRKGRRDPFNCEVIGTWEEEHRGEDK